MTVAGAASELADAVAAKDEARVGIKFKAFGKACGNCHPTFRAKK